MTYYNWPEVAASKTDRELAAIVGQSHAEPLEKVDAAVYELHKRGYQTSSYPRLMESIRQKEPGVDENLPLLYSEKVIYTFSILFSVLFGAVLFCMNLSRLGKQKAIYPVIIFSVVYLILSGLILNALNAGTSVALLFTAVGAVVLNSIFWARYIGKEVKYTKRNYNKPLLIAIAIFIPLTLLVLYARSATGAL